MEVMPDPVHWLVACDPQFGIHRFIQLVKGNTSLLLRSAFPMRKRRLPSLWTNSYLGATAGGQYLYATTQPLAQQDAERVGAGILMSAVMVRITVKAGKLTTTLLR
jgi:putative transposase